MNPAASTRAAAERTGAEAKPLSVKSEGQFNSGRKLSDNPESCFSLPFTGVFLYNTYTIIRPHAQCGRLRRVPDLLPIEGGG